MDGWREEGEEGREGGRAYLVIMLDRALEGAVDRVKLKHVLEVVRGDERVIDGLDAGQGLALRGAGHQSPNTTEAVNPHIDRASGASLGVGGIDDVNELGLERRPSDEETVDVGLAGQICLNGREGGKMYQ